jgi:hypothetical protein
MTAFFARDDSDSLYASEGICHLLIYGDYDKVLFNLLEYMQVHGFYKRGDNPIPVEIDLTGVDELRFNVQYATLYNIEFTPAQ